MEEFFPERMIFLEDRIQRFSVCFSKSNVSIKITKLMKGKMGNYCYSYNSNSKINSICWLHCIKNPTQCVSPHLPTFTTLQNTTLKTFCLSFFFFFWESTTHSKWSPMAATVHSMKQQQHLSFHRAWSRGIIFHLFLWIQVYIVWFVLYKWRAVLGKCR